MKKWIKKIVLIMLLLGVLGTISLVAVFTYFSYQVYGEEELKNFNPETALLMYDRADRLIAIFSKPNSRKTPISYDKIPKKIVEAFTSVEDKSFFEHSGIDYLGILRAVVIDIVTLSKKQGASTITQQVAKNLLLSNEKTISRKIKEMILAKRVEKILSKEEILSLYLNNIYFGNSNYGIVEASRFYFNKSLDQLSLVEIAYLAGVPKNPSKYSLNRYPEESENRKNTVLKRMLLTESITEKEYQNGVKTKLKFDNSSRKYFDSARYFTNTLFQQLKKDYGEAFIFHHSLKIKTSLDAEYQLFADKAVKKGLRDLNERQGILNPLRVSENLEKEKLSKKDSICLNCEEAIIKKIDSSKKIAFVKTSKTEGVVLEEDLKWVKKFNPLTYSLPIRSISKILEEDEVYLVENSGKNHAYLENSKMVTYPIFKIVPVPEVQGALLSIDTKTREIIAMIGGFDFEISQFNRATQSIRQPGSVFKPFVYAAAIKYFRYNPATIVYDLPEVFKEDGKQKWIPQNFKKMSFQKEMTLKEALTQSVNMVAVKLLDKFVREYSFDEFFKWIKLFGITTNLEKTYTLALGSLGVRLIEITNAVATFPSQGVYKSPQTILSIENSIGQKMETPKSEEREVLTKEESYLMIDMMKSVVSSGTAQRASSLKVPTGGKTGTTNSNRNTWFVGFTENITTGVWVGFDDMKPLGNSEQGGRTAAPIWLEYMKDVVKVEKQGEFYIPENIIFDYANPKTGLMVSESNPNRKRYPFIKDELPEKESDSTYIDTNAILQGTDD